jgi:hypothetical protein
MRYAIIENGQVVNIILWDGQTTYDSESVPVLIPEDKNVGPGWSYDGTTWTEPEQDDPGVPVDDPAVIQAKQDALSALVAAGVPDAIARTIVGLPAD